MQHDATVSSEPMKILVSLQFPKQDQNAFAPRSCLNCKSPIVYKEVDHTWSWQWYIELRCVVPKTPAMACKCSYGVFLAPGMLIKQYALGIERCFESGMKADYQAIAGVVAESDFPKIAAFAKDLLERR